jgi:exopolysaccharide biosynthesis operon protein EpsL
VNINRRMTLNKKLTIRSVFTLASIIMAAPAVMAQMAQVVDTNQEGLHFQGRLGLEHDSNVLRVGSGAESDTAYTAGVGLTYNKQFSLQRIRANIQADTWRYNDHSELNFSTVNYAAAWDWRVTTRFHGTVSADRRQFREITTDPVTFTNRIGRRTERTELAEGAFDIDGPWRVMAGVSHYRTESDQPGSWDASPDITYGQVGVGYEAASGSSASLRYKRGKGEYKDPTIAALVLGTDFHEDEVEARARWSVTGKTTVDARLAHVKREHDNAPQLDFSGVVGGVSATWDITGKTSLVAGYQHDISATGLATGGHVESDRFFLAPVWHATAKTSLNLRYDHTQRKWKDTGVAIAFANRNEKIESIQAGVDWEALRTITVSGYIRQEKLHSSVNAGYRANVYGVAARANF